jgi:hypothetical protein
LYYTTVREAKEKVWTSGREHPYCPIVREAQANALGIVVSTAFSTSGFIPVPMIVVNAL